jgi:hypothetical protein
MLGDMGYLGSASRVMQRLLLLWLLLVPFVAGADQLTDVAWVRLEGEWVESPPDIAHERSAPASVITLMRSGTFALLHCWIIEGPDHGLTLSNGDPFEIFTGRWTEGDLGVDVTYKMSEARLPEAMARDPGLHHSLLSEKDGALMFEGRPFARTLTLPIKVVQDYANIHESHSGLRVSPNKRIQVRSPLRGAPPDPICWTTGKTNSISRCRLPYPSGTIRHS